MNDALIRQYVHSHLLKHYHASANVLVVDELGLQHGRCRADIAVVNGSLDGYEIKSNEDSLERLSGQVKVYSAVFNHASVIVGTKHADTVLSEIPDCWGVIVCDRTREGNARFKKVRAAGLNNSVDAFSVAQLLWSNEASSILEQLGEPPKVLRQKRSLLYERLCELLSLGELRREITKCLKSRKNWRCL